MLLPLLAALRTLFASCYRHCHSSPPYPLRLMIPALPLLTNLRTVFALCYQYKPPFPSTPTLPHATGTAGQRRPQCMVNYRINKTCYQLAYISKMCS